ncbi:formyltetrahydrofolate deformylase [Balneolaceae bacterium ANBcel3]|nr:formyltetrahydrofolate deformylase [Balneolaceae bacterium ANBcel3]
MKTYLGNSNKNSAILLIHCPDQKGIVAAVTRFMAENNGNILEIDQHVDKLKGVFFMRVEWDLEGFAIPEEQIEEEFARQIARPFQMKGRISLSRTVPRMAVFVSRYGHCLHDILARYDSGEWNVHIPLIISNHPDMKQAADRYGIDYHQFDVTKDNKSEVEAAQKKLLGEYNIDVMILARYMQILSDDFVADYPGQIINIHHSFLPAFPGARPYHSAFERGVKVIGATSHYVTADLDEGPIIEQDVIHVNHRHSVEDLVRKGRDLEKVVLARAIWHHLQRRTLVFENRTIVFQ